MIRTYKTEGIVIKRINFGEADKILTIFTPRYGKIVALVKGVRKINSRKSPHVELFNHIKAFLHYGRTWDYITEAESIETFAYLRSQLDRVAYAFRIVEEVDRLCAERQVHKNIFDLLLAVFLKIDNQNSRGIDTIVDEFTTQLLWGLGYLPRGKILPAVALERYLEHVMETSLKSKSLLSKI